MAPLTRFRANRDHVHGELAKSYYAQRASVPGTLIVSEGTVIAPQAGGFMHVPGIWSDAQIAGWKAVRSSFTPFGYDWLSTGKKVTDAVHANGSFIFLQLWALGRVASRTVLKQEGGFDVVGPSPVQVPGVTLAGDEHVVPRELTVAEIKEYIQLYTQAAKNAIEAGFDGVELHAANGCLLDQFLQSVSNKRTDEHGGSIENRLRFPLEVIDSVVKAIGAERTSVRLSPWSKFQGKRDTIPRLVHPRIPPTKTFYFLIDMGMKDPLPTFAAFVERIRDAHPNFAYIHVMEKLDGPDMNPVHPHDANSAGPNDVLRKIWGERPYIAAGGFHRVSANSTVEKHGGLIAFGRHFIANVSCPHQPT
jgi:NADPH2 dehydrogenase